MKNAKEGPWLKQIAPGSENDAITESNKPKLRSPKGDQIQQTTKANDLKSMCFVWHPPGDHFGAFWACKLYKKAIKRRHNRFRERIRRFLAKVLNPSRLSVRIKVWNLQKSLTNIIKIASKKVKKPRSQRRRSCGSDSINFWWISGSPRGPPSVTNCGKSLPKRSN